jgi:hypothetical protein
MSTRIEPPATRARTAWLVVGAVLTTATIVVGSATAGLWLARQSETRSHTYQLPTTPILLDLPGVDVVIMTGESGNLTVQRHLTWATAKPDVQESWDGQALRVRIDCPSLAIGPGCGVDYLVRVPPGLALEIRATSGDVRGTDLRPAELAIRTRSGDVDLRFTAAPRRLEVETGSGDVDLMLPGADAYHVQSDAEQSDVDVRQHPTAPHTITVHTDGGSLSIRPSGAGVGLGHA